MCQGLTRLRGDVRKSTKLGFVPLILRCWLPCYHLEASQEVEWLLFCSCGQQHVCVNMHSFLTYTAPHIGIGAPDSATFFSHFLFLKLEPI